MVLKPKKHDEPSDAEFDRFNESLTNVGRLALDEFAWMGLPEKDGGISMQERIALAIQDVLRDYL